MSTSHHCCCCPCKLEPVVLFSVSQRDSDARHLGWVHLGNTIDLSHALRYKDSNKRAWINVHRGFMDPHGLLYNEKRERVGVLS